jgi:hypothetical protein
MQNGDQKMGPTLDLCGGDVGLSTREMKNVDKEKAKHWPFVEDMWD